MSLQTLQNMDLPWVLVLQERRDMLVMVTG
jgi:hypothetical protein